MSDLTLQRIDRAARATFYTIFASVVLAVPATIIFAFMQWSN